MKPVREDPDLLRDRFADSQLDSNRIAELARRLARLVERRSPTRFTTDNGLRPRLLAWARHYLPHHFTLEPSTMHRWLEEQFETMGTRRGVKLNVIGPRGGAKSTIGTLAWPLRLALERAEPYLWIVSDTKHQAFNHLENLKAELVDNRRLQRDYPESTGRGAVWRGNCIVLANGVVIEAVGTGQHIRGRRSRAHRPTVIICDDLQNDQHICSAGQRERSRTWFNGTLLKAGTKRTNLVNLATALHREALGMELLRTPGWTSRLFRAIEHWPTHMTLWNEWESLYSNLDDPLARQQAREFYESRRAEMDEGAKLLWPAEEDLYTLMCMRAESGRTAFEREKQGSPISPELCEWPETYFDETVWFDDWPHHLQLRTMALDPSKGNHARHGDFSALVMLGVDRQGVLYVEADLARRPTTQMVADGVAWCRNFRPDAFGIEANQYQDLLAGEFVEEFRRQRVLDVRPWLIDNQVNKLVRIRRLGPWLSSRRIRFKAGSPSTKLLVEQLKEFPLGDHDDGPDSLEMALRLAVELDRPAVPDPLGNLLPLGHVP